MSWKVTINGKEVQSPRMRVLGGMLAIAIASIALTVLLILSPILVPLHFILRAIGREGFASTDALGKLHLHFDKESFRRAA